MVSTNLNLSIIFFTQTGVWILENSSLFCLYIFTLLTRHMLRPTDWILIHLVIANNLVLFNKGTPQRMATFELKYFLGDVGCKFVFYLHRVGVSLGTACLSGFRPLSSILIHLSGQFKDQIPNVHGLLPVFSAGSCISCWISLLPRMLLDQERTKT